MSTQKSFLSTTAHAVLPSSGMIWQGANHSMNFWSQQGTTLKQHKITLRSFLSVFFMSGTKSLLDDLTFNSAVSSNVLALTGLC